MALRNAQITQSLNEKRYNTLLLLEASYVSGNKVRITPVKNYDLTDLSSEVFEYDTPITTFIILNERPKVDLLKRMGWYRENVETPMIATIPTHLLYNKETGLPTLDVMISGTELKDIVNTGETSNEAPAVNYELRPIKINRGTLIDIFYDFLSEDEARAENRFMVGRSFVDTVSLFYTVELVPYKYPSEANPAADSNSNTKFINFDNESQGI